MESDVPPGPPVEERDPSRPVRVEVITYAPTVFYHCQHCELVWQHAGVGDAVRRDEALHALPPDLREEFGRLSTWVHSLLMRFGRRVTVKVVDAASLEGVFKSLRYRIKRYPAIVVDRQEVHVGSDFARLDPVIARYAEAAGRARNGRKGGERPGGQG